MGGVQRIYMLITFIVDVRVILIQLTYNELCAWCLVFSFLNIIIYWKYYHYYLCFRVVEGLTFRKWEIYLKRADIYYQQKEFEKAFRSLRTSTKLLKKIENEPGYAKYLKKATLLFRKLIQSKMEYDSQQRSVYKNVFRPVQK